MLRKNEGVKEFKNGNLNIKLSPEDLESIKSGKESDIEVIEDILFWVDSYFVGEEFCLSNFDMGAMIYNCYSDLIYIISFSDIDNILMSGKTLKLYGRTPDADDREYLKEYEDY